MALVRVDEGIWIEATKVHRVFPRLDGPPFGWAVAVSMAGDEEVLLLRWGCKDEAAARKAADEVGRLLFANGDPTS